MQAHELLKSKNKNKRRVGRGGKRGSFSGRGIKGQRARAGRRIRPQIRDIIKKMHKRRGHGKARARSVNPSNTKPIVLNIGDLENKFENGDKITIKLLVARGLIKNKGGHSPKVKILGDGKLTKKLTFEERILLSKSAKTRVGKI